MATNQDDGPAIDQPNLALNLQQVAVWTAKVRDKPTVANVIA